MASKVPDTHWVSCRRFAAAKAYQNIPAEISGSWREKSKTRTTRHALTACSYSPRSRTSTVANAFVLPQKLQPHTTFFTISDLSYRQRATCKQHRCQAAIGPTAEAPRLCQRNQTHPEFRWVWSHSTETRMTTYEEHCMTLHGSQKAFAVESAQGEFSPYQQESSVQQEAVTDELVASGGSCLECHFTPY